MDYPLLSSGNPPFVPLEMRHMRVRTCERRSIPSRQGRNESPPPPRFSIGDRIPLFKPILVSKIPSSMLSLSKGGTDPEPWTNLHYGTVHRSFPFSTHTHTQTHTFRESKHDRIQERNETDAQDQLAHEGFRIDTNEIFEAEGCFERIRLGSWNHGGMVRWSSLASRIGRCGMHGHEKLA